LARTKTELKCGTSEKSYTEIIRSDRTLRLDCCVIPHTTASKHTQVYDAALLT